MVRIEAATLTVCIVDAAGNELGSHPIGPEP